MPCNSDYMNQTPAEAHNQMAARLLLWLDDKGLAELTKTSRTNFEHVDTYYSTDIGQVKTLCCLIDNLDRRGLLDPLIRDNALDRTARQLADWIDDHEQQDARRAAAEVYQARKEKVQKVVNVINRLPDDQLDKMLKLLAE